MSEEAMVGMAVATATVVVGGLVAMQVCGKKPAAKPAAPKPAKKEKSEKAPGSPKKRVSEKKVREDTAKHTTRILRRGAPKEKRSCCSAQPTWLYSDWRSLLLYLSLSYEDRPWSCCSD